MTIKDIAKLAGVSVSTVSKVMNQKDSSISQKTRERVLQVARSCNYSPYAAFISQYFHAKLLIRENSLLFGSVMKGLLSEAQSKGYTVSLSMIPKSDPEIELLFSELEKSRIDLILWEQSAKADEKAETSLEKAQRPAAPLRSPFFW